MFKFIIFIKWWNIFFLIRFFKFLFAVTINFINFVFIKLFCFKLVFKLDLTVFIVFQYFF